MIAVGGVFLSLTPGFSRVSHSHGCKNGFNRFWSVAGFKPLKRLELIAAVATGLKPVANESLYQGERPFSRSPSFRFTFFVTRRPASLKT
jgi:hypothetical protein